MLIQLDQNSGGAYTISSGGAYTIRSKLWWCLSCCGGASVYNEEALVVLIIVKLWQCLNNEALVVLIQLYNEEALEVLIQ